MARKTDCFAAIVTFLLAGLALGLMALVTLPRIQELIAHVFFDLRACGYDKATAGQIVSAVQANARGYYLALHLPLDTVFPALFAATFILGRRCLARRGLPVAWGRIALLLGLASVVADYAENLSVLAMVLGGPVAAIAPVASVLTIAKTWAYRAAVLAAAACVARVISGSRSRRRG